MHEGRVNRILVVGGSGFIGRATLDALRTPGFEIHATYLRRPPKSSTGDITWHQLDLMDRAAVVDLLSQLRPSHLMALAWQVQTSEHAGDPLNIEWVSAMMHLLGAFVGGGGRRTICAGTYSEYGPEEGIISESNEPKPTSFYAVCKDAVRQILSSYASHSAVEHVWARIFTVYGPNDASYRLIPYTITTLLSGEEVLASEGGQVRDFVHVSDVGRALALLAATTATGIVNIGSGQGHSVREVVTRIASATGGTARVRFGTVNPNPDASLYIVANIDRLVSLGWSPHYDLERGLNETLQWYRGPA